MPTTNTEGVPLNIWLPDPLLSGSAVRRHIADRLVETYTRPDGTVIDLTPSSGEVRAAATSTGRRCLAVRIPPPCARRTRLGCLDAIEGTVDLAVALPPGSHLRPPRPHPLSAAAAGVYVRRAAPLLRAGGFLVLGTLGRRTGSQHDPVTDAVSAATTTGLAYFQHLIVVLAPEHDYLDQEPRPGQPRRLTHADLLVFCRSER